MRTPKEYNERVVVPSVLGLYRRIPGILQKRWQNTLNYHVCTLSPDMTAVPLYCSKESARDLRLLDTVNLWRARYSGYQHSGIRLRKTTRFWKGKIITESKWNQMMRNSETLQLMPTSSSHLKTGNLALIDKCERRM